MAARELHSHGAPRCQNVRCLCKFYVTYLYIMLLCRANILIDKNYNGKVGDFGFCLEIPQVDRGRTHVTAPMFARTEGYYAPELTHGELSTKSDVYSYGVVSLHYPHHHHRQHAYRTTGCPRDVQWAACIRPESYSRAEG